METETTHTKSALDCLQGHFEQMQRRKINCEIVPEDLYVDALNAEDYLYVQQANSEKNHSKKIMLLARFICKVVKKENGEPAFTAKGGNAAEILATKVDPTVFFKLFGQLFSESISTEVEELEKKSQELEPAS